MVMTNILAAVLAIFACTALLVRAEGLADVAHQLEGSDGLERPEGQDRVGYAGRRLLTGSYGFRTKYYRRSHKWIRW